MNVKNALLPLLTTACLLMSCGNLSKITPQDLAKHLELTLDNPQELAYFDNHGGFSGDGISCIVLQVNAEQTLKQIAQDSRWQPCPLKDEANHLIRETTYTAIDLNQQIPEIKNGFFRLIDRQSPERVKEQPDILKRPSLNLTLAIFDADTGKLYVVDIDT